jgi:hypothetical protein
MAKKLSDIKEIPQPSPEVLEQAKKLGITILAHDPNQIEAFVRGRITLGELEGISKDAQYQMAKQGFSFMREGKLDQAKTVFEGLQALDPFDAYFHMVLGTIAQEQGDQDKAEKLYTRSLEINPFSPVALAQRGEIRLGKGQFAEALADLGKSVQEDPEGNEPAARRARVLLQMMKQQLEASKADPAKASRDARMELQALEAADPSAKKGALAPPPGGKTDAKAAAAKPAVPAAKTDPKAAAAKPAAPAAKTDAKAAAAKPAAPAAKTDAKAAAAKPAAPAAKTDAKAAAAKPAAPAAKTDPKAAAAKPAAPAAKTDPKAAAAAKPDPKAPAKKPGK